MSCEERLQELMLNLSREKETILAYDTTVFRQVKGKKRLNLSFSLCTNNKQVFELQQE